MDQVDIPVVSAVKVAAKPKKIFEPVAGSEPPSWNKPEVSDGVVRSTHQVPKTMRMGAQLQLHTHLAINLFRGRRGDPENSVRPIIGLARFARQVALVWSASEQDDPYADQVLVDVEEQYNEAKTILATRTDTLSEIIGAVDGMSVEIQTSIEPAAIDLQFYCPWSYRVAMLLLQFDKLVRLGLTARHIGLIGNDEWTAVIGDSGKLLRRIFSLPNRWVSTGVTRDDVRKKTKAAKRALVIYSEVKEGSLVLRDEVIDGERAMLAPPNTVLEKYIESLNKTALTR